MGKFDDVFNTISDNPTEVVETQETTQETQVETEVEKAEPENKAEAEPETETEVKAEDVKEEEKQVEKRNWRERYQETDEFKAKLRKQDEEAYAAKLKKIEQIESNPVFQIVSKAIEQGVDPIVAMRKVAVDEVSTLTPKDLFMKDLEKYKDSLTEDEINEEIEKFESKSKLEQIKATEGIKNELTAAREAELSKFKTVQKESTLDEATQAKVNKFDDDFENRLNALDGKTINGVTFTPAVLSKIEETIAKGLIRPELFMDENGNFDADEAIELAVLKHYRQPYLNGLKGQYKSDGIKEALKEKHNVASGKAKTTGIPDSSSNAAKKKADIDFVLGRNSNQQFKN